MVSAAGLFAMSKSQHAVPGFLFAALFLVFAVSERDRITQAVLIAGVVLVIVGGQSVLGRLTWQSRADTLFNAVFMRIAPPARDRAQTLQDLGLGPQELRLVGTYGREAMVAQLEEWAAHVRRPLQLWHAASLLRAASIRNGSASLSWTLRFYAYAALGQFGARRRIHRTRASDALHLLEQPPLVFTDARAVAYRFARSAGDFGIVMALRIKAPGERRFAALVVTVQLVAAMEYAMAILADGLETDRHLFMFHVATEATILLTAPLLWKIWRLHHRGTAFDATALTGKPSDIVPI